MDKVRTAFIGVGYRGKQLFRLLQNIPFFQVQAVADPGVKSSEISGIPCYNQGEDACLDMLKEHHPELVFIASPWQYHVQHALLCVEHGCHVALEIKGGLYIDEYTPLMELAEQHGCRVYPLENTLFMLRKPFHSQYSGIRSVGRDCLHARWLSARPAALVAGRCGQYR